MQCLGCFLPWSYLIRSPVKWMWVFCKPDHTDSQQHTHAAHTHTPWRHTHKCPNGCPMTCTPRWPNYNSQHHNNVHTLPMHACPLVVYPHIPRSLPTDMLPEAAKQWLATSQQHSHAAHTHMLAHSHPPPMAAYTHAPRQPLLSLVSTHTHQCHHWWYTAMPDGALLIHTWHLMWPDNHMVCLMRPFPSLVCLMQTLTHTDNLIYIFTYFPRHFVSTSMRNEGILLLLLSYL
jgi:hypothetical protein